MGNRDDMSRSAIMAPPNYRYELRRIWDPAGDLCTWCCLNPSTADAYKDDPSVRRMINLSRAWGHGGMILVNLFAWRATDPRELSAARRTVGPANDGFIRAAAAEASRVIAAWGVRGALGGRAPQIAEILHEETGGELQCLATTKRGYPKHPLYIAGDTQPRIYTPEHWRAYASAD
ncbi:MAG: DUF1643 domain-containing protein [Planctomycetota bacterium]